MGHVSGEPDEVLDSQSIREPAHSRINRRTAVKGLAGAAAASLVWAEPTIKGLARRPAYAAGTSTGSTTSTSTNVNVPMPAFGDDPLSFFSAPGTGGTTFEFFLEGPFGNVEGKHLWALAFGVVDGGITECDFDATIGLEIDTSDGGTVQDNTGGGLEGQFVVDLDVTPTAIRWTSITATCTCA